MTMGNKVLLIDKSIPLGHSVEFVLGQAGYEVDLAEDEREVGSRYHDAIYDLVIVDLKGAGDHGTDLLGFLKSESPQAPVPVLALIAPEDEDTPSEALPGVTSWITIPFSNEKLISNVRKICQ